MSAVPIRDDRRMIESPDLWPYMRLPLKRRGEVGNDLGFLMTGPRESGTVFLYKGNMFAKLSECEQITYPDVDALLADGWKVD